MNKFSEALDKARSALNSGGFVNKFAELKPGLTRLLGTDGPVVGEAGQLAALRKVIETERKTMTTVSADLAVAKVIIAGAGSANKKQERVATLKMLRHLYHVKSAGGQTIWVYSPPLAYSKWIFDEVAGASDVNLESVLSKSGNEVYSYEQRGVMASAIQETRAVVLGVVAKLGSSQFTTRAMVRRYFGDANTTSEQLTTIISRLLFRVTVTLYKCHRLTSLPTIWCRPMLNSASAQAKRNHLLHHHLLGPFYKGCSPWRPTARSRPKPFRGSLIYLLSE